MKLKLSILTLSVALSSYLHANECQDLATKLISDEFQGIQSSMNGLGQCCTTIAALPFFHECVEIESMRAGVSVGNKMELSDALEGANPEFLECKQMARSKLSQEGIDKRLPSHFFVDGNTCVVETGNTYVHTLFTGVQSNQEFEKLSFELPIDPEGVKQIETLLASLKKNK